AVGDDHVNRFIRQRDTLDVTSEELDILEPRFLLVRPRERQHLVGHVEAVDLACLADALGGEQHIDAAARSQIENRLSLSEINQRSRIPTPKGRRYRLCRQVTSLRIRVEAAGDRIGRAAGRVAARGRPVPCGNRRTSITLANSIRKFFAVHLVSIAYSQMRIRVSIAPMLGYSSRRICDGQRTNDWQK